MRAAVIVYHKNITQIYPSQWVEKFKESIENQTLKDVAIFELNYGGGTEQIFPQSYFESRAMPNFAHAMNYLLSKAFEAGNDCVYNSNVDDFYDEARFEKQLKYVEAGFDIVSSNFALIRDGEKVHTHYFDELNIQKELDKDHNIICHPVVAYSKKFWELNMYYPDEIPLEDMRLWQRSLKAGYKFIVLPEILCYHRLHDKSVGHNLEEK